MRIAWGIENAVGAYLSARFPTLTAHASYRPHVAVGFVDADDRLVGGLALRFLSRFDASLSIAIERTGVLTPGMLRTLFAFAFLEIELARLTCQIAKRNRRARRLVEGLGFRLEGVKRRGFDGRRDACLYGMTAGDCRWLDAPGRRHGDRKATARVARHRPSLAADA